MKRLLFIALFVIGLVSISYRLVYSHNSMPVLAAPAAPETVADNQEEDVKQAIEQALDVSENYFLAATDDLIQVTNIVISEDRQWASAWLVLSNPQTGEPLPSEPGIALAIWDGSRWVVSLPTDPTYSFALVNSPVELLPPDTRSNLLAVDRLYAEAAPTAPLTGYLLPWRAGETVSLSRSVAHDADITSGNAHYSFDFYISQTMFDIHAAKSGTVFMWRDDVPNNNHDSVNYIVLEDPTTSPVSYQLYLHLAQNSIPASLKQVGAPVAQGQYIAIADNTGASTGHHLHFQVESTPYWQYWGKSVDIIFNDVNINGGRPRVSWDEPYCTWAGDVCNEFRSSYISANIPPGDLNAPQGDITTPQTGVIVEKSSITLQGWASDDDSGLNYARFKANFNGSWVPIGPLFSTSPFSYKWDLCSDHVPDGPVSVSLEIRDNDGNFAPGLPGLRHFLKNYTCPTPPPACNPGPDQVALYADPDYKGSCLLASHNGSATTVSNLGSLGTNNAASIQVGSNLLATLFMNSDGTGRGETFTHHDANLSDNRIGIDRVSSLIVQPRTLVPATPQTIWPPNGATFSRNASISLAWEDRRGSTEFKVELNGVDKAWQTDSVLHLGSLAPGGYSWRVKARNASGESTWSDSRTFTLDSTTASQTTVTAPYSDDMESGTNGWNKNHNWDQTDTQNHTTSGEVSWMYDVNPELYDRQGYDTGEPNADHLTSPPIEIPATGYYLRFWYRYDTEGPGLHWDQRWVQLSVDGGPFTNLLQLHDDPPNVWLQSPAIDLSSYANQTVQVRFHFETFDASFNTNNGWFIDDFSITNDPPPACASPGEPDSAPEQARPITYNNDYSAEICPGGDADYYKFSGSAGDHIGASTQAQQIGSSLDTYLFLLDSDGISVLAENDDLVYSLQTDSQINYQLPRTADYYLKVRAWNHPTAGGQDHYYTLGIYSDGADPSANFIQPPGGTFLPISSVTLEVEASDAQSGISHVDFYWHPGDWKNTGWIYIGTDSDPQNGWTFDFITADISDQRDIAFYAQVHDQAGNRRDVAIWDMAIDRTPPVTALSDLPGSNKSTVIQLQWTGNDNLAGIDHYDIQGKKDNGSWQDWLTNISANLRQAWFIVETGHEYHFRLRGVDRIGNTEEYPSLAETSTTIPTAVCTSPDSWENDNTQGRATLLEGVAVTQNHNFCNPESGTAWQNDQDWYRITLKAGVPWRVEAIPANGNAPASLRLFDQNGNLLDESLEIDFGETNVLEYRSNSDRIAYLQIIPLDGRITGDEAGYRIISVLGYQYYFPLMSRK